MSLDNFEDNNENNQNQEVIDNNEQENPSNSIVVEFKEGNNEDVKTEKTNIPEKFLNENGEADLEKIMKSYQELEKRFSKGEDKVEEDKSLIDNLEENEADSENKDDDKVDDVSIDDIIEKIESDFKDNNKEELSEEEIKSLKDKGLSDKIIENLTKNWKREITDKVDESKNLEKTIYEKFEGQDNYKKVFNWLKQTDENAFNLYKESLQNGNPDEILSNVDSVLRRFKISGESLNGSSVKKVEVFSSINEYYKEINSQRYKRDVEYQKEITEKAKRSGFYDR